jgi:hypothetical protein
MGIEVSLAADGVGAQFRSYGVLTSQDLLDANQRLHIEITRNPGLRYLLVDHSAIPEEKVDTASLRLLAERVSNNLEIIPEGFVAIVAPNDVLYGLSRMWETLAEQSTLTTRVMRTRAEAVAWLKEELAQRQLPFILTE